jgi:hypothetical protein
MYENENVLGDEIRYVINRKNKKNQLGNTLDRPTLLMKRNFIRATTNQDENLQKETQFRKRDLGAKEIAAPS